MYGAKGQALVNSEADAGAYVALAKGNTTNGAMTLSTYQGKMQVVYMTQENIDANQNTVSKTATLMDESGNASFPGKVTASNGFGGNRQCYQTCHCTYNTYQPCINFNGKF